jgi:hypothetical protein
MAGTFVQGISKVLSGVYTLIVVAVTAAIKGTRGKVAYCFTSDWGPVGTLKTIGSAAEFRALYNADKTALTAAKIYKHAYNGKPYKVLGFRMATGTAAKGSCTLKDDTAQDTITLETLYPSARAFVAVVKAGVSGGKTIQITEGGVKLVEVAAATVADLVAALNKSDYVKATAVGANLPANTAGTSFAGGNNGSNVTATEYAAFLDELEADGTANAFSYDAVTDNAILETAKTWTLRVRDEGLYITFVMGGPASWDETGGAELANAASKAANSRGIINVGNGCEGYTAAEMAIFIAARAASVALNRTLTDELTPYLSVNKKLKKTEREAAKLSGTLIFVMDGDTVVIDEGVNTLTTPHEGETVEYSKIRVSNTLDSIAKDLEAFGEVYKRDKSNTPEARELYAAAIETDYLAPLQQEEVIQAGYFYRPDPDYHGENPVYAAKADEAFFYGDITPVDSMERVYQKIGVHF